MSHLCFSLIGTPESKPVKFSLIKNPIKLSLQTKCSVL